MLKSSLILFRRAHGVNHLDFWCGHWSKKRFVTLFWTFVFCCATRKARVIILSQSQLHKYHYYSQYIKDTCVASDKCKAGVNKAVNKYDVHSKQCQVRVYLHKGACVMPVGDYCPLHSLLILSLSPLCVNYLEIHTN